MEKTLLGKNTIYYNEYNPNLLQPIARIEKRQELNISNENLPFAGTDIWNAYELSWLNHKGKPEVRIGRFTFNCTSSHIIESKSLKLYLGSLHNTKFASEGEFLARLTQDLSNTIGNQVKIELFKLDQFENSSLRNPAGILLDDLDIKCSEYLCNPGLLKTIRSETVSQKIVCTNLLKSNCLITNQPDWASLQIIYSGVRICHNSLLQYIVSLRNHNEFHEQCVERIFMDLKKYCAPEKLLVVAYYTRRGGLDINPVRYDCEDLMKLIDCQIRTPRQ